MQVYRDRLSIELIYYFTNNGPFCAEWLSLVYEYDRID